METTKEVLTEEELMQYRSAHQSFKQAEKELAYITSELSIMESRKISSLLNYSQSSNAFFDNQGDIITKYGEGIQIDMTDGSIIRTDESDS
tara:strand:- start:1152 stop:1424 length:273 start_codon:yes stop_codon:yes gene_type:complete